MAGRIFGGFLMRRAFELAFATCYSFAGSRPAFLLVDDIAFRMPVDVADLLRLKSSVIHVEHMYNPGPPWLQSKSSHAIVHIEVGALWLVCLDTFCEHCIDLLLRRCLARPTAHSIVAVLMPGDSAGCEAGRSKLTRNQHLPVQICSGQLSKGTPHHTATYARRGRRNVWGGCPVHVAWVGLPVDTISAAARAKHTVRDARKTIQ